MMLNVWTGTGRLTADPVCRTYGADAKLLVNLTLAIDRDYKDVNGNTPTDFVHCTLSGHAASFASKYLAKGRMVSVTGRLQQSKWTDDSGNNRTSWAITVSNIWAVESRKAVDAPAQHAMPYAELDGDDDELPF